MTQQMSAPVEGQNRSSIGDAIFEVDTLLTYDVQGSSEFLFQIHAFNGGDQTVLEESMEVVPNVPVAVFDGPQGRVRCARLQMNQGPLEMRYRARVLRARVPANVNAQESSVAELPNDLLHFLNPTRYCQSDVMSRAAQKLFGELPQGHQRVQAICDWIHENVEYQVGTSTSETSAVDVFTQRVGVCRDFAHLGITFCRALNIPARLVAGYAKFDTPPPDFHAVFEAFIGGGWQLFDATRMSPPEDLVRIGWGHDAKDIAFATIFGPAVMLSMQPNVERVDRA